MQTQLAGPFLSKEDEAMWWFENLDEHEQVRVIMRAHKQAVKEEMNGNSVHSF